MEPIAKFYTDDGSLQLDLKTHAFGLVGQGSITATDHWSGAPYALGSNYLGTYALATPGYDFDLVFFRCTDAFLLPTNLALASDSAGSIRVYTQICWYNPPSGASYPWTTAERTGLPSHQVDYWAFRSMRTMSPLVIPGKPVFRMRKEDGSLIYDSNLQPAIVTHNRPVTASALSAVGETLAAPTTTALMKYGTSADASVSGSGPSNWTTSWHNQAVKNTSGGYDRRSFLNTFPHGLPYGPNSTVGSGIYTGGFIGIDVSQY